ncbi:hypothetical protein [Nocardioides sp. CFH 31398]|uniref:hypothetical protein n=1 Tax=Nocardioides sp. CFH 31398 TaxID=2919579 RepID=UPI001F05C11F|nr:hypothetical protein [Nocardioides sp. CFH 31398]MCH1866609.1 hypothetical protein [Nocardioides sp. CFH 31398]
MKTTTGTLASLALLGLLVGCGQTESSDSGSASDPGAGSESSGGASDETTASPTTDELCPAELPDDGGNGFGVTDPAAEAPELPSASQAWVCQYDARNGWQRAGEPVEVPEGDLAAIEESLAGLEPSDPDQMCTEELGPRWLLVTADDAGSLTGVSVDGFGCRSVRLTDSPSRTAPGRASGDGLVEGTLTAPGDLSQELSTIYGG